MAPPATGHGAATGGTEIDPVCGMRVDPATAAGRYDHRGTTYYFCAQSCLQRFKAAPDTFIGAAPRPMEPVAEGAEYVCPMDPEVRQDHPGACPKCGMALEPAAPARPTTTTTWTCPMHPEVVRDAPGTCPKCGMALEPQVVTVEDAEPRARGHDAPVVDLPSADRADPDVHGVGAAAVRSARDADRSPPAHLDRAGARHAGGGLGRAALLRTGLGVDRQPLAQHVHADRAWRGRGLRVQRGRHDRAGHLSALVPDGRRSGGLLRAGGGDRGPGAPRPGPRASRAGTDRGGDPEPAQPRAACCAPHPAGRPRARRAARAGGGRRPAPCQTRRAGPGRRHRARRHQRDRRVDGDR